MRRKKAVAYRLTHHLLQLSMQKGLGVFDRTAVTDIIHEKNNILLHTEDGYAIISGRFFGLSKEFILPELSFCQCNF